MTSSCMLGWWGFIKYCSFKGWWKLNYNHRMTIQYFTPWMQLQPFSCWWENVAHPTHETAAPPQHCRVHCEQRASAPSSRCRLSGWWVPGTETAAGSAGAGLPGRQHPETAPPSPPLRSAGGSSCCKVHKVRDSQINDQILMRGILN